MSDRLTPEREAETTAGRRDDLLLMLLHGGAATNSIASYAVDALIAAVRAESAAEIALLQRKVASLKELQAKDDAEYAQAISERDRALETLAFQERHTLPELRRAVEHHKDGKQRWRERAEKAEAALEEARRKVEELACPVCKGSGMDPDDEGDWDSAVGRHNPNTVAPCPTCMGDRTRQGGAR